MQSTYGIHSYLQFKATVFSLLIASSFPTKPSCLCIIYIWEALGALLIDKAGK